MNTVKINIVNHDCAFEVNRATEKEIALAHSVIAGPDGLRDMAASMSEEVAKLSDDGRVNLVIVAYPAD